MRASLRPSESFPRKNVLGSDPDMTCGSFPDWHPDCMAVESDLGLRHISFKVVSQMCNINLDPPPLGELKKALQRCQNK